MPRHSYDYAEAGGLKALEQVSNNCLKAVSVKSTVKVHRRIYYSAEFHRAFDDNTMGFQCICAKWKMLAVPFDTAEGDINHRKVPGGCFQLTQ